MTAKIISIINMKGGVGKTTLTCNISSELAERGFKVLVIDSDPQFNTTQTLFKYYLNNFNEYRERKDRDLTISNIFTAPNRTRLSQVPNSTQESIIFKLTNDNYESLDIIPGDLSLIVDVNSNASDKFKEFFYENNLKNIYDYIIIDCPPTWGNLTSISLSLSNYYLIPTRLDDFSTIGITLLSELISSKVRSLQVDGSTLKCLGVVYMMLNPTRANNGIAINHRPYKTEIESFYQLMSQEVNSMVTPFDEIFYSKTSITTSTVMYKQHTNYPDLYTSIIELVSDIITRIDEMEGNLNEE